MDLSQLRLDGLHIEQLWFLGDSPSGEPTLRGGHISDLRAGICWVGKMNNGQ